MTREEILTRLQSVTERHLSINSALRLDQGLVDDLEMDSIQLLTLAVEVENEFRVVLHEESGLETVGDLVKEISRQLDLED